MSVDTNERWGSLSSSSVWKLMTNDKKGTGFGAPGLKYIKQVCYEQSLGRPINKEASAKPTSWGTFIEHRVFEDLNTDYIKFSQNARLFHPEIKVWSGIPDLLKVNDNKDPYCVGDVKCPFSLEMFCDKVSALTKGLQVYKESFPEDYFQHVSNAILLEANGVGKITHFEAVIYCPYKTELQEIRESAARLDDHDLQKQLYWLDRASDEELPYIIEGGQYKNLNVFNFEIPVEDKLALTTRLKLAAALLK